MAFKGDAEMQFQRQFYKLIPHSVIFVLNWTEVSHLLGGEKGCSNLKSGPSHFWQTSFAYPGNGKAGSLVKPEISLSSMSEMCYSGTVVKRSWEAVR